MFRISQEEGVKINGRGRYNYSDTELKKLLKSAVVLTDTREQENEHILTVLDKLKVQHKPFALPYGDYSIMLPASPEHGIQRDVYYINDIMIERKRNLNELAGNFTTGRERFKDEMIRAGAIRKYLIVECASGYAAILGHMYNAQLSEKSFYASLLSFQARYDLNVIFIEPQLTAEVIWGLLYYHIRAWLSE
jgi:ERCC4-type nuclease